MVTNTHYKKSNISALNWLQTKIISRENGILISQNNSDIFENIQDFIVKNDHSFETPVTYYQAFPKETTVDFLNVLGEELSSKLGINIEENSNKSLKEIVTNAALKMVILDKIYLYSLDTINDLLNFFLYCNITLILIIAHDKLSTKQLFDHPLISQWEHYIIPA